MKNIDNCYELFAQDVAFGPGGWQAHPKVLRAYF